MLTIPARARSTGDGGDVVNGARNGRPPLRSTQWWGKMDPRRLHPPLLDAQRGFRARRLRRAARHRDLQFVVGVDVVQRASAHDRRGRQARRVGSRRVAARISDDLARRNVHASDVDAVPQPHEHGRRRVHPREPNRRRRVAVRLRQNDPRATHGCRERRLAGAHGDGRTDAQRQVSRRRHRFRHHGVGVFGRSARWPHDVARLLRCRSRPVAQQRPLHDDGHGVDDGEHGGSARPSRRRETRRFRRSILDAWRSRNFRGAASSRWCARISRCRRSSRATRSKTRFASTRRSAARRTR